MLEAQLVGSQEFLAGAGGTNAGFVAEAYRELLGRDVDAAGATFWQNAIAAGTSRTAVAQALLDSNEGVARQLAAAYQLVLLRARPPAGSTGSGSSAQGSAVLADRPSYLCASLYPDDG